MSTELSFKTAICTEYEGLLFDCQKALEAWRNRQDEISAFGLQNRKTADELIGLQAEYARSYSRLERHAHNCELCNFVTKTGGANYIAVSASAALEKKSMA
jgi:hypothetical protein